MFKRQIRLIALALTALLVLSCFAGCKKGKDVYGAASEFVKTGSQDKTETTESSDDNGNVESGQKTSKTDSSASDKTQSSDQSSASSANSPSKTDSSAGEDNGSSSGVSSENNNEDGNTVSTPQGDYGPVVRF